MSSRPKKYLGQHFLRDPNTARKIVRSLQAPRGAPVVEIGPGDGALTGLLVERFDHVTAIEFDEGLAAKLQSAQPEVDVRRQDVLEVAWTQLAEAKGGKLHVIGNLPYNITSPILFDLLDARSAITEVVVMMQLEVAQRLVADPGSKQYGIPSVLAQLQSRAELLFRVSRHVFYPKPQVESAVVRLTFEEDPDSLKGINPAFLREVVRTAFGQRRKMLRNSLRNWTKDRGVTLPNDWGRRRPESLAPEEFVELATFLGDGPCSPNL